MNAFIALLPVDEVVGRGAQPAGDAAVVTESVFMDIAIVAGGKNHPQQHLFAAAGFFLAAHPAQTVIVNFLEHLVLHARVGGVDNLSGNDAARPQVFRFRRNEVKLKSGYVEKRGLAGIIGDEDLANLKVFEDAEPAYS